MLLTKKPVEDRPVFVEDDLVELSKKSMPVEMDSTSISPGRYGSLLVITSIGDQQKQGYSNRKKHDNRCEKVKRFFLWTFCKHIRFFFRLCETLPGHFSHVLS